VQCRAVQTSERNAVQYRAVQYSTVQGSTVQYSAVQGSEVQCSTVQRSGGTSTWRQCTHVDTFSGDIPYVVRRSSKGFVTEGGRDEDRDEVRDEDRDEEQSES
jgi:hypothetical protein